MKHALNRSGAAFAAIAFAVLAANAGDAASWEKPKTNQRYIQGPLAERLLVASREGKVIHSEMFHDRDWRRMSYLEQPACGVWLVHGDADESFDFRTARMRVDPEGVPIHGESWTVDGVEYDLEACSPVERAPSAHIRLKVTNRGAERSVKVGFLVRNSHEFNMIYGAPDIYRIYNPKVRSWKGLDCDQWRRRGDAIVVPAQNLFVTFRGDSDGAWDAENGVLRFEPRMAAGETRTYDLVLGRQPEPVRPDYGKALARTRADWLGILKRIEGRSLLEKCLVVQILQCYARASGSDTVLPRQGGLQRWVWPWDQSYAAAALTRLGYGEYVEMACDFYFGEYARPDGMIGPFGMGWVNDTANVLGIFSRHCLETGDARCWRKHREAAERAFRWIRAERAKSAGLSGQVAGLFPAGIASDNRAVFQAWDMTDILNLQGLELFARAAGKFGEPFAAEVAAEARDYRGVIAEILDRFRRESAGKEAFIIPNRLDGKFEEVLREQGYHRSHPGYFAIMGFLDETDLLRVRKGMLDYGVANDRGLYFNIPSRKDPDLGGHIWYTTAQEYNWFYAWKRVGRDDLARQALDACLKWAVTDEYLVGERMHDANPWYFPWCPNASGSGRILLMLLDAGAKPGAAQNLLSNGDFEDARPDRGWSVPAPWKVVAGEGRNGGHALVWENDDEARYSFPYFKVPLEPGAVYRFGAWVKVVSSNGRKPRISVDWDDDKGNWMCSSTAKPVVNNEVGTDGWEWHEGVTKPIPGNVGKMTRILCYVGRHGTGKVLFDGFMLRQEGSKTVGSLVSSAYHNETSRDAGPVRFVAALSINTVKYDLRDLRVTLGYSGADGARHEVPAKRLTAQEAEFEVDSAAFACGAQKVTARVRRADEVLGEESVDFSCTERPRERRVSFDRQGRVHVDGKPVFPMGMYAYSLTDEQLDVYARSPFNMIIQYGKLTTADLDRYFARGIRTVADVRGYINGYSWGTKCKVSSLEDSQEKFRELVRTLGAHPGLLAWYLVDEAPYDFHATIIGANRFLNSIDPHHPTYAVTDKPGDIGSLLPGFDVIGVDPYPVANPHQPGEDFSICSKWVEQARAYVRGMRPMWTVPQAFNWVWYEKGKRRADLDFRMPSRKEMANMNWQSVAAGANGLGPYAFHPLWRNLSKSDFGKVWGDVCSVAEEIRREERVLLSDPLELGDAVPPDIVARAWEADGTVWLLLVNRKAASTKGVLRLPAACAPGAPLEGGGAELLADGQAVSYDFDALGYALLSLKRK